MRLQKCYFERLVCDHIAQVYNETNFTFSLENNKRYKLNLSDILFQDRFTCRLRLVVVLKPDLSSGDVLILGQPFFLNYHVHLDFQGNQMAVVPYQASDQID